MSEYGLVYKVSSLTAIFSSKVARHTLELNKSTVQICLDQNTYPQGKAISTCVYSPIFCLPKEILYGGKLFILTNCFYSLIFTHKLTGMLRR